MEMHEREKQTSSVGCMPGGHTLRVDYPLHSYNRNDKIFVSNNDQSHERFKDSLASINTGTRGGPFGKSRLL